MGASLNGFDRMAELPSLFTTFLQEIRPTAAQVSDYQTGHKTLRDRLRQDPDLSPHMIADFLQGSYRRSTAIRPRGDAKSDVDIIVVTDLDKDEIGPREAMDLCEPFLEKHYSGKWRRQGRSFGISLSYVEMDLVLTAAPSEATRTALSLRSVAGISDFGDQLFSQFREDWRRVARSFGIADAEGAWKLEPLDIPNREANIWEETHPLATYDWTIRRNARCSGHYINAVKALKWWRVENEHYPERPKGYPIEHIIGDACPGGIGSVAAAVTLALENIRSAYRAYADQGSVPFLADRGIPTNNVLARLTGKEFETFYDYASDAATLARSALDESDPTQSARLWRQLFGEKFPKYRGAGGGANDDDGPRFTPRRGPTTVSGGRFALLE